MTDRPSPEPSVRIPWPAKLLPRGLRDRVFLPAYYDRLWQARHAPPGRWRAQFTAAGMVADCWRVGILDVWGALGRGVRRGAIGLAIITVTLLGALLFGGDGETGPPGSYATQADP